MALVRRSLVLIASAIFLVGMPGCANMRNAETLKRGPSVEFSVEEISQFTERQSKVLSELQKAAGSESDWDLIIAAGMDYSDRQCEEYLHALFRLNRDRRTAVTEVGLVGTATAGLMAAAQTAASTVAATAIVFGLTSASIENLSGNLLFDLDPSSVRTLVNALHEKYRQALGRGYADRPATMRAIRQYATICVPANIEAEVNLAVKKAQPSATKADPPKGKTPTVSNADLVSTSATFEHDKASELLDAFVFPGGKLDANNQRRLENFLRANDVLDSALLFINSAARTTLRVQAVKFFGLSQ